MKQVMILKYNLIENCPSIEAELYKAKDLKEANEIVKTNYKEMKKLCKKTYCGEDDGQYFNGIEEDEGAIVCSMEAGPEIFFAAKIIDPEEMDDPVILYNDPKTVAKDELNIYISEDNEEE